MGLHMTMEFEILGTRIAMKCHFSSMNSCVVVNLSIKIKTLSTIVTLQWYLFSVYSLYKSFQVTLKIETFHPSVARKWPLRSNLLSQESQLYAFIFS